MNLAVPVLDEAAIQALLPRIDIPAALKCMFAALHAGEAVQPPQTLTLFPNGAGDFIAYAGMLAGEAAFGVKLSPYIVRDGSPLITAWTLLMSARTGEPLLLCDSKRLTTERTAAVTALAVDLLTPPAAETLAIVGTGDIAEAHLRHVLSLRAWRDIRITSPSLAHRPASDFTRFTCLSEIVRLSPDLTKATRDADAVLLSTSSAAPVLDPAALAKPALITSISTNALRAHEIPPAALAGLDVYCDYRRTAPLSAGEMVLAAEGHGWSAEAILGDLPELVAGAVQPAFGDRHRFFRSIGMGLEDIAVAIEILNRHKEESAA
jgi:L-arginine dehydrogenase